jgi:hypothetical protein
MICIPHSVVAVLTEQTAHVIQFFWETHFRLVALYRLTHDPVMVFQYMQHQCLISLHFFGIILHVGNQ